MKYAEAVEHVRRTKAAAYAFVPRKKGGKVVGGDIYIVHYSRDHEREPEEFAEYYVDMTGGFFYDSFAEEDSYWPEDVPEEVKALEYEPTMFETGWTAYELQVVLRLLQGAPLEEALKD